MSKKASIIKDNKVINRIVLPDDWSKDDNKGWKAPQGCEVIFDDNAKMNYEKVGGEWVNPDEEKLDKEE